MSEKVLIGERVFPVPTRNTAKIRKQGRGGAKGTKGHNCKTSPEKKYWLCNPKAHKKPEYERMVKKYISQAGG